MSTEPANDFWPQPLAHCGRPLVLGTDEEVVIGEITSEPVNGFYGIRMLFTALVPLKEVDLVLTRKGGIGQGVTSSPRHPAYGTSETYSPVFTIQGPGNSSFESMIHTWTNHNRTVLMPDSAFLMCYELTPRIMKDSISWDDPDRLVYDVVRVIPESYYSTRVGSSTARVTVRRDYLEDYLSLKNCAAVATFWDERLSFDDPQVASFIGERGAKFEQPGRTLWFMPTKLQHGNQASQVWGCAALLTPNGRPITDPLEPELQWPDRDLPIKGSGRSVKFKPFEDAYVRDEVLSIYEKRNEFQISPEHGYVSYDGRWSVSYCDRFSRNYIELELRKLYEGVPFDVIKHFNKFAVKAEIARRDLETCGNRHVGIRAKDLVYSYLRLIRTLCEVSDAVGQSFTEEDIGQYSLQKIEYSGWWTFPNLNALGNVVPLTLPWPDFTDRCTDVFKLLENLRPAPLLHVLIRLGLPKDRISKFGNLKLLQSLSQLAALAKENGLNLVSDCTQLASTWDPARVITECRPLFALYALRVADAHNPSARARDNISEALDVFGIDQKECRTGWGKALDLVYDRSTLSLDETEKLIRAAII